MVCFVITLRVGELATSITKDDDVKKNAFIQKSVLVNTDHSRRYEQEYKEDFDQESTDLFCLARDLFDLRELKKAAYILKEYKEDLNEQSCMFMHHYCLWMHGDMVKKENSYQAEYEHSNQGFSKNTPINLYSKNILETFKPLFARKQLNDLNCYLYGLALKENEQNEEAIRALIQALNINPCLWTAWLEICLIITKNDITDALGYLSQIKTHWMKNFFFASLMLENLKIHTSYDKYCFEALNGLLCFFRDSNFLINQLAHLFYFNQEQHISLDIFKSLLTKDPYRTENLDTYSNMLFVKDNQQELGALATDCYQNNKYCPETCCAIGNYYSLMGEHEKSITYFKRALALDRYFISAYTLIGHEYLELKLMPNAIDSYNSALNIDPHDFRAWYGLGQAYELQNLSEYSLVYYGKAGKSKPRDYRMWNALAACYEKLDKMEEAARCSERSEWFNDKEGIAIYNLGKMYSLLGYEDKVIKCFEESLNRSAGEINQVIFF